LLLAKGFFYNKARGCSIINGGLNMKRFFFYYILFCLNVTHLLYPMDRQPHSELSTPTSPTKSPLLRPSPPNLSTFSDEQAHLPLADSPPSSPQARVVTLARPGMRRQITVAPWLQARNSSPDQPEITVASPLQHNTQLSFHSLVRALHQHNQNCSSPMPELFTQDTLRAPPPSPTNANTPINQEEILVPVTDQQPVRAAAPSPRRLLTTKSVILGTLAGGLMLIPQPGNTFMPRRGFPSLNTAATVASTGFDTAGTITGAVARVMSGGTLDSVLITAKIVAGITLIIVIRQTASSLNAWVQARLHGKCQLEKELLEQKFNNKVDENQRNTQQLFNDFDATTNEKIRLFTQQVVRAIEQVRAEQHNGMTLVARTFSSVSDILARSQQPQPTRLTQQPAQSRPQNTTLAITAQAQNPTIDTQQRVPIDPQLPGTTNIADAAQAFRQAATEMQDMAAKAQETQQVIDIPAPILAPQLPPKKEKTTCSGCCQQQ